MKSLRSMLPGIAGLSLVTLGVGIRWGIGLAAIVLGIALCIIDWRTG